METLIRLIEIGNKEDAARLEALVTKRLNTNADEILADYIRTERSYVDKYCLDKGIDQMLVMSNKGAMIELGMALITKDIKDRTLLKAQQDIELKKLGIETISITNEIETKSKWMRFLDGPKTAKGLNRKLNKFINSEGVDPSIVEELKEAQTFLNDNFIDMDKLRPDINKYWDVVEYTMSEECEGYLLKYSGK